ncbi:RagB/SusD family protein [Belliella baltica DSM 15883]|uniref:RagB/SusD family protein n=1 Tax=Belliella baltica (strain DSM 15883 / CIP 108006 / LMG 21964 / BA134) TaxID=866536 RepID=I3Z0Y9_BELBD|nr:RagB/SusD family nutrient uptake outer membrane protein [Belliella baltica]AFL82907.1 RagB/SusD family protein [Belliella baltica DSM 15883]
MKNIFNKRLLGSLLGVAMIASSCSDDLLNLEPVDSLSSNAVFVNQQGANAAVLGMYGGLADGDNLGFRMNVVGDIASNDVSHTGSFNTWRDLDLKNWDAVNGEIGAIWASAYNSINRANNIIAQVDGIDMAQALKDQYKGEALFVRALNHFNLANYFGDVPLITTPTAAPIDDSYFVSRDPKTTVYTQIISDLNAAIGFLPVSYATNNDTRHRATRGAAQALLAKVYLYDENYAQAETLASEVISNSLYSLVPFESMVAGKGTQEAIFELFFDANNQNPVTWWYGRDNGGRFEFGATEDLWNSFEAGDLRRQSSIREEAPGVFVNFKYRDNTTGTDGVHILRIADMYLTRAEARIKTGNFLGASQDIQSVRRRAFNDNTLVVVLPTNEEAAMDVLLDERRLEFAFEGHRWHDMVRTGRAEDEFGIPSWRTLMPIPLNARDVNPNLTQNPNY